MFPQGTTPTFILSLPQGWNLTLASKIVASFHCSGVQYDVEPDAADITATTVTVRLTQEQTLAWVYQSDLKIQLNWLLPNGTRIASTVWMGKIDEQLLLEVMS